MGSECGSVMPGDWISTKAEWTGWGENILTLAVLSILITAPLGAISILALGPKLLERDENFKAGDDSEEMNERDIEGKTVGGDEWGGSGPPRYNTVVPKTK